MLKLLNTLMSHRFQHMAYIKKKFRNPSHIKLKPLEHSRRQPTDIRKYRGINKDLNLWYKVETTADGYASHSNHERLTTIIIHPV